MKNVLTYAICLIIFSSIGACTVKVEVESSKTPLLKISENKRFFTDEDGNPFFWLGDTGWLLFTKLNREDAVKYLEDRQAKGFNVIQVMVLHSLAAKNIYGDSALINKNVATPLITDGNSYENPEEYDYWDHVDYLIEEAAEKGLYMALVPVWGSNVKSGGVSREEGAIYAEWIANRYKDEPNIIWLNGGDILGSDSTETWKIMGETLDDTDPNHLITFHPRGRMTSSVWFHNEDWLDFNMFQSGHRRYDQDDTEWCFGEDNWRYVEMDYNLEPVKPTLDGEPSYEGIPQGLHDTLQPFWKDNDVRRYAYWSVFSGGAGFTYGHSAVMQFYVPTDKGAAYGAREYWDEAINHPGAGQMIHLKKLMLSRSYFDRVPDQSIIGNTQGEKYACQIATRGKDYAFVYVYNGGNIEVSLGKIEGKNITASWFDPRTGEIEKIGQFQNQGQKEFDPPGDPADGNDWVLILDSI